MSAPRSEGSSESSSSVGSTDSFSKKNHVCLVASKEISSFWLVVFLKEAWAVYSTVADIVSDVFFYIEFQRTFGWEHAGWHCILLGSLIVPHLIATIIILRRRVMNAKQGRKTSYCPSLEGGLLGFLPFSLIMFAADCVYLLSCSSNFVERMTESILCFSYMEFVSIRSVTTLIFEDIPQLAVQTWMFSMMGTDSGFGVGPLVFSFIMTLFHSLGEVQTLKKTAASLENISLCRYIGYIFGFTFPDDDFAGAFANQIREGNYPYMTMNLSGGGITDDGCTSLANALRDRHEELEGCDDIEANCCDCSDGERIVVVRYLFMTDNDIGDAGLEAIAEAMAGQGCAIKRLVLAYNDIGDAGVIALAESLQEGGNSIQKINLCHNPKITEEGYMALAEALKGKKNFKRLFVTPCPATDTVKDRYKRLICADGVAML